MRWLDSFRTRHASAQPENSCGPCHCPNMPASPRSWRGRRPFEGIIIFICEISQMLLVFSLFFRAAKMNANVTAFRPWARSRSSSSPDRQTSGSSDARGSRCRDHWVAWPVTDVPISFFNSSHKDVSSSFGCHHRSRFTDASVTQNSPGIAT